MYVEGRRKGLIVMCCLWIIVPLITAYLLVNGIMGYEVAIAMLVSGVFSVIGIAYYAGKYEIMSGFSTMSIDEIVKYDMKKLTWFSGVWLYISSMAFFFLFLFISMFMGSSTGLLVSVVAIIALLAIWAVIISTSRFKVSNCIDT